MAKQGRLPLLTMIAVLMVAASCVVGVRTSAEAAAVEPPIEAAFSAPGPFAATTGTVTDGSTTEYDLFYPSNYRSVGFKSPIVTWGNGTGTATDQYSSLLLHLASYGFTVIATTRANTGSGREIDAAAHYLVKMDATRGSVFDGHLNVHRVAAVGHSQGATGAARVAIMDPTLISTLITFSLPAASVATTNPDCPVVSDCEENMASVHQPTFLISTHGPEDSYIARPSVERAYFNEVKGRAVLGIIKASRGVKIDHISIENEAVGGYPDEEIAYATAWLEFTLRGNRQAAGAFTGAHPELTSNPDWPGSLVKS
jgi:pimeloyl-ACP methyl ester carboxylesterase